MNFNFLKYFGQKSCIKSLKPKLKILIPAFVDRTMLIRIKKRGVQLQSTTQSRIIGAVRWAHSQLWETTLPVFSPYAPRKYDMIFGTPAIV